MLHGLHVRCEDALFCSLARRRVIAGRFSGASCVGDAGKSDVGRQNAEEWVVSEREDKEAELMRAGRSDDASAPFAELFRILLLRRFGHDGPESNIVREQNMYGSEGADYVNITCTAPTELSRPQIPHPDISILDKSTLPREMCAQSAEKAFNANTHL